MIAITVRLLQSAHNRPHIIPNKEVIMIIRLATIVGLGLAVAATAAPSFAATREGAIRDCNGHAAKYINHVWGNVESSVYRSCMAEQGYRE